MTDVQLDTSFLQGGIQDVNFFNGRVLTAEDLRDQQAAGVMRSGRLGRAIGGGVVNGFSVTASTPWSLDVTAGLAVTRRGETVELVTPVEVPLVHGSLDGEDGRGDPCAGGVFEPCVGPDGSFTVAGDGVYIFVVAPASESKGEAPRVSFDTGVARDCGPRYVVEGIAFRLIEVNASNLATEAGMVDDTDVIAGVQATARRRNALAHMFLGTVAARALYVDAVGAGVTGGATWPLDVLLHEGRLTESDVPLALITWRGDGIDTVDAWSVRRRAFADGVVAPAVEALVGRRRAAEAEAVLLQFQDEVRALLAADNVTPVAGIVGTDVFRYLPPAGLLPLQNGGPGFDLSRFFQGIAHRAPVAIPGSRVEPLLRTSLAYPPVDLVTSPSFLIYDVDENVRQVDAGDAHRYVLFASADIPDIARRLEIVSVFPSGPVRQGQEIEVRGHDFGVTDGSSSVDFDGADATEGPSSTDTKLMVVVPTEFDVGNEGKFVGLTVAGSAGDDSVPIFVLPGEPALEGKLRLAVIGRAERGLRFLLTSELNRPADVTVDLEGLPEDLRRAFAFDVEGEVALPGVLEGVGPGERREFDLIFREGSSWFDLGIDLDVIVAGSIDVTVVAAAGVIADRLTVTSETLRRIHG